MPEELAEQVSRLMVNSVSCTASLVQRAGIEALSGSQETVRDMVSAFRKRRDLMVEGLNSIPGISCREPAGAFYVFPNITGVGTPSKEFADRLLDDFGVAALSGTSFGEQGEGYLRLSYANSEPNLARALDRIDAAARQIVAV
jgi:aspartate/methionine/tyrosine aminotransferase